MRSRPVRRLTILFVALATAASITAYFIQTRSTWAGTDPVWPTSSDSFRPSTPAGKLILDSSTGLPAVAPMTMNFVRTPDTGGPDGKGRFLIAVNSGYGIVTSSKTKPQQTLSVIDLAAAEPTITNPP